MSPPLYPSVNNCLIFCHRFFFFLPPFILLSATSSFPLYHLFSSFLPSLLHLSATPSLLSATVCHCRVRGESDEGCGGLCAGFPLCVRSEARGNESGRGCESLHQDRFLSTPVPGPESETETLKSLKIENLKCSRIRTFKNGLDLKEVLKSRPNPASNISSSYLSHTKNGNKK